MPPFLPLSMACPWPEELFPLLTDAEGFSLLDKVGVSGFSLTGTSVGQNLRLELFVASEIGVGVPGMTGWEVLFNAVGGGTNLAASLVFGETTRLSVEHIALRLRAPSGLLVPVQRSGDNFVERRDTSGAILPFEISLTDVSVTADSEGNLGLSFQGGVPGIRISPFRIEGVGLVVEDALIRFVLSPEAASELGLDGGRRGLFVEGATIHLPPGLLSALPDDITLSGFFVGSSGISGVISGAWSPVLKNDRTGFEGAGSTIYEGFAFALDRIRIELVDNIPLDFEVQGRLLVPWFEEIIETRGALSAEGRLSLSLSAADSAGLTLRKDELVTLELLALAVERVADGTTTLQLSGRLQPELLASEGMRWPELEVRDLRISSEGALGIGEAWLDLKDLATLDLWGFKLELAKLGIGTDDPRQRMWLDLAGSLRLMDQLPVGLGIEGFKLSWPQDVSALAQAYPDPLDFALALSRDLEVSFAGVELFYGVPKAVEFTGLIRFFKDAQVVGFAGDMALRVPATGFGAEAGLLIGFNQENPPYPFLYLYFGVDLPAGIPLGQSGLALKSALGMFGINVVPAKDPEQNWYYDWYKRGPIVGAHPTNKWKPGRDGLALGVGVTITTADGYIKGTRGLLVLSLPGPILMIEGRALLLNGLSPNSEPPLRALAVFDGNEGTVQFNVEAEAELVEDVVEAYAMMEAFFDFNDVTRWHLYLGQDEPNDRRIRADILKFGNAFLFKSDAYLMLAMVGAETLRSRMGVFVGFKPTIPDIGPVKVTLEATLEGKAEVTVRPEQFSGEVNLEGTAGLSVCGVGVQVGARADLMTDGPLPFNVEADVDVSADMPWPLDPVDAAVHFEWSLPAPPQIEPPLSQVTLGSRFSSQGQALSATGSADDGKVLFSNDPPAERKRRAERSPVVAMDSHVVLEFTHELNSEHFARHPDGEEKIFDVGYFRFTPSLKSVRVYECKKNAGGKVPEDDPDDPKWTLIAETGSSSQPLPGVWTAGSDPVSPEAPSARRVQLWTDNPLLHTHAAPGMAVALMLGAIPAGKPLAGRILDDYPELMRPLPAEPKRTCISFEKWAGQTKRPGEEIRSRGVSFHTVRGNMVFQTIENQCQASQLERIPFATLLTARRKLRTNHPELERDTGLAGWRSWATKQKPQKQANLQQAYPELNNLWEALFPRKKTCVCLGLPEDLVIHFPEPVTEVVIHLCRPAKIPESNERPQRVTARTGVETIEEFEKQLRQTGNAEVVEDWKDFRSEVESIRRAPLDEKKKLAISHELTRRARALSQALGDEFRCAKTVPVSISGNECEWTIRGTGGRAFLCLHLSEMKGVGFCRVCWVTKSDEERAKRSEEQAERNRSAGCGSLETTFRRDCCYRIVVGTEVERSVVAPPGLQEFFNQVIDMLDEVLGISNPATFSQTAFFQTESPPADLTPYVKWSFPDPESRPHFLSEQVSVRFLRPHLKAMFADPAVGSSGLKLAVRDPSGNTILPSNWSWSRAVSVSLFPEEQIWQDYRATLGWNSPADQALDDVLTAEFSGSSKLSTKTRYELLLVDDKVQRIDSDTPKYFQTRFLTSAFDNFKSMVQSRASAELGSSPAVISPASAFSIETIPFLTACRSHAASRRDLEMAKIRHRFDRLEEGRSGLEERRLSVRTDKAALDDAFRSAAMAISPGRLFGKPGPNVDLALVGSVGSTAVMGVWITAPESLEIQSKTTATGADVVGRTTWDLFRNGTRLVSPEVAVFFDSCSRHLLLVMVSEPMSPGNYRIVFQRTSRLPDAADDSAHWFDRPSLPLAGSGSDTGEIKFVIG
jgi:hypothetical protein